MSYYANQNPYSYGTLSAQIPDEDRHAAALAHASTLIAMVVSAGWLSFVGWGSVVNGWGSVGPFMNKRKNNSFA